MRKLRLGGFLNDSLWVTSRSLTEMKYHNWAVARAADTCPGGSLGPSGALRAPASPGANAGCEAAVERTSDWGCEARGQRAVRARTDRHGRENRKSPVSSGNVRAAFSLGGKKTDGGPHFPPAL